MSQAALGTRDCDSHSMQDFMKLKVETTYLPLTNNQLPPAVMHYEEKGNAMKKNKIED